MITRKVEAIFVSKEKSGCGTFYYPVPGTRWGYIMKFPQLEPETEANLRDCTLSFDPAGLRECDEVDKAFIEQTLERKSKDARSEIRISFDKEIRGYSAEWKETGKTFPLANDEMRYELFEEDRETYDILISEVIKFVRNGEKYIWKRK